MKAASTSETSVNFYQTTRRNNPEDSHLHTRCRVNLKSQLPYKPEYKAAPKATPYFSNEKIRKKRFFSKT
jgi:hypothetical protein